MPPTTHRMNWTVGRREPRSPILCPLGCHRHTLASGTNAAGAHPGCSTLHPLWSRPPALWPLFCPPLESFCGRNLLPSFPSPIGAGLQPGSSTAPGSLPRRPRESRPDGSLVAPLCAGLGGLLPQRVVSVLPQRVEEVTLSRLSLGPPAVIVSSRDPSFLVQSSSQRWTRQSRQAAFGRP